MNYTEKHHLPQWEEKDRVKMEDFNQMCANIENGIEGAKKELESGIKSTKTELESGIKSTKTELESGIKSTKTELESGIKSTKTELESSIKGVQQKVTVLEQGQLVYKIGNYTGTGEEGRSYPNRLEFSFKPLLVVVYDPTNSFYGGHVWVRGRNTGVCQSYYYGGSATYVSVQLTWEDQAVQWYYSGTASGGPNQLNTNKQTYGYLAIGIQN